MNPKLIIASLGGFGVLGGGVTGCYYYCGQKASEKQKSTTNKKETTLDTSKSQETVPQTKNREDKPQSQGQPLQNKVTDRGTQASSNHVSSGAG